MKDNFTKIIIVAILASSCVYPRYFRGPSKDGYGHITLHDSVDVSVSYMEAFVNISEKHVGSSISIKTFVELDPLFLSKLPIEVHFDSLRKIKTEFFVLEMSNVNFSKNGALKDNTIFFPDSDIYVQLVYRTQNFKKRDKMHYSETQKVWIPSFIIKQGSEEYVTKGFWSIYPKDLRP
ncbi:MAG: hypothetical protein ACKOC0_09625 [Cytophagales bacterium]